MDHIRGRLSPLDQAGVHVCVDMQLLFSTESLHTVLVSARAASLAGQWWRLHAHCPEMTRLDCRLYDIVPELAQLSPDLATIFPAMDAGFRVIIVEEEQGILPRFDQQVELVGVDELLSAWP